MKNIVSKTVLLLGSALILSIAGYSQERKIKVEDGDYELKIKQEKGEFKIKEKGTPPRSNATSYSSEETYTIKQGETVTTVKPGVVPKQSVAQTTKTSYAGRKTTARKPCTCKTTASKSTAAKKRTTAYRPKTKTAATRTSRTAVATTRTPVIVRDTVFVTRVDTVFSMNQQSMYSGYRQGAHLSDDFVELKIEKERDGEIILKKEYEDGREIKKVFDSEEDLQTYLEWKNF